MNAGFQQYRSGRHWKGPPDPLTVCVCCHRPLRFARNVNLHADVLRHFPGRQLHRRCEGEGFRGFQAGAKPLTSYASDMRIAQTRLL